MKIKFTFRWLQGVSKLHFGCLRKSPPILKQLHDLVSTFQVLIEIKCATLCNICRC
jgi:hypothetical protein